MSRYAPSDLRSNFYTRCMSGYFRFRGRTPRRDYWLFTSISAVIYVAISIVNSVREQVQNDSSDTRLYDIVVAALLVVLILHVIPSLSASVRRLHDIDRSGWMIWISLIPLVGGLVLLFFYVLGGTEGDNNYGPDPYGEEGLIRGGSAAS